MSFVTDGFSTWFPAPYSVQKTYANSIRLIPNYDRLVRKRFPPSPRIWSVCCSLLLIIMATASFHAMAKEQCIVRKNNLQCYRFCALLKQKISYQKKIEIRNFLLNITNATVSHQLPYSVIIHSDTITVLLYSPCHLLHGNLWECNAGEKTHAMVSP